MPDLVEQMYCSEQITVPTMFPYILKQFAKAAIRTQPYDLLQWSASYFSAMANGEEPPVKHRIEYPPLDSPSGLTPGYLRVLLKQLGLSKTVTQQQLYEKWTGVCLNENCLTTMLQIGGFGDEVPWLQFMGIAAGHLTDSLAQTMCLLCELLTEEPEGGSAMISTKTFNEIYVYLAGLDCGPPPTVDNISVPSAKSTNSEVDSNCSRMSMGSSKHSFAKSDGSKLEVDSLHSDLAVEVKTTLSNLSRYSMESSGSHKGGVATQTDHWHVPGIGPLIPPEQVAAVLEFMLTWSDKQEGMTMPRNIRHYLCPPLDKLPLAENGQASYYYPKSNVYPQLKPLECEEDTA